MDDLKTIILNTFSKHEGEFKYFSDKMDNVQVVKSADASDGFRNDANGLYSKKGHDNHIHKDIFHKYCKSITHAPNDSDQLIFAFAKRSAFLMHINKYEDCISDIDNALNIIKTDSHILLKIQLLCRKIECLKILGLSEHSDTLKQAQSSVNNVIPECRDACEKLISKVESLSINDNVSTSKKNNELHESENFLDQVTIKFDNKYGRHLVAAKDYKPGDIIFVEKLYATDVNPGDSHIFCNYCMKLAWSGIPCENCNWAIFCSDLCKQKALNSYHDIECTVIAHLKSITETTLDAYYNISLRLLILGIRETGSLAKLKQELKTVEECTDICPKGFNMYGQFGNKTIHSVYSLKSHGLSNYDCETTAIAALLILLALVKHRQLMKHLQINCQNINNLVENEDVLFLGSVILKLIILKCNNCYAISHKIYSCEIKSNGPCIMQSCCTRGSCLAPLASLLNHSCFPNASKCFTENQNIVIFALQPIKKNSQIFVSYSVYFYNTNIMIRKTLLSKYSFDCSCEACTGLWIPLLEMSKKQLAELNYKMNKTERKLYDKCHNIFAALDSKSVHFEKGAILTLADKLVQSCRFQQPSILTSLLMRALNTVFLCIYGLKPPPFGQCKI